MKARKALESIKIERVKAILRWLCGIWSFGLGFRIAYSLCIYDYMIIPSHPLNIFFDFIPLAVLGAVITVIETKEACKKIIRKRSKVRSNLRKDIHSNPFTP